MSAVPAEVVVAKTGVEEPLVVHVVNVPASGPQNNVLLLPKELDEKIAKMHFFALIAELIVLSVEVFLHRNESKKQTAEQQCCMEWSSDSFSQCFLCRSHERHMLQDAFRSSSLYENSGPSVEIQRQVRIFSEGIAHSSAAQQGCMFPLQNVSWVELVRRISLSSVQAKVYVARVLL